MGSVYLAHDEMLGRDVAVKTIAVPPAGKSAAESLRSRFMNEARAIASLSHPNVVNVFDAGVEGDTPFLVMEVVPGPSLKERLAEDGPLDPSEGCALGIQIAQALQEAHDAGIVHRDVKPANILRFRPGQWKLGDFGVARIPDSSLTLTGQFLGTPAYAAPETLSEGMFAPSCDIYALAATLYEAVAGAPPFPRSPQLRMAAIASGEPPKPLAELAPHAPADLAEVIGRGLEADPAARPSAAELAEALAVVSVHTGQPPAASEPTPSPGGAGRRGRWLWVAILALAGGGGALAIGLPSGDSARPVASAASDAAAPAHRSETAVRAEPAAPRPADAAPPPPDAAPPADAAPPDAATARARPHSATPSSTTIPELERVRTKLRAGRGRAALSDLESLRERHPDVAEIPYLMGRVYFDRMWWTQGFDNYRAAIDLDPSYREDPKLIADAIEALKGSKRSRARRFLESVIGGHAIPQLREAVGRTDSLRISRGARAVLDRLGADQ